MKQTLLAATALAALGMTGAAHAVPAIGLSNGTSLFSFDTTAPGAGGPATAISGLQTGEILFSIDYRPATGILYGLGSSNRLYTINAGTGAATATAALSTTLVGSDFDIAFNPMVDRLRVVGTNGMNYRIVVDTGMVIQDTSLAFAATAGQPVVTAVAYSGQRAGMVPTTTLFDIESSTNSLYNQVPPNNGTLNLVGPLSIAGLTGFDIDGLTGTGYAATSTTFYSVNADNGGVGLIGAFGRTGITDFTLVQTQVPEPMSLALLGMGAVGAGLVTRRRRATTTA